MESYLLPLTFTILATTILTYIIRKIIWSQLESTNKIQLPPSPKKLPLIGNLHQLGLHPHRSLRSLARTHGPIMLLHMGNTPVLSISSAELAREIMRTQDLNFATRPNLNVAKKLLYNHKDIAMAPYGEYWRQMKSISVIHLLSNKRVMSFRDIREEETFIMINKILNNKTTEVNLSEMLATLTNDVVCQVALGRKYYGRSAREGKRGFKELVDEFVHFFGVGNIGDYIPWLAWLNYFNGLDAKMERVATEFDEFLDCVLEEHRVRLSGSDGQVFGVERKQNEDFVDVLLQIQKENTTGFPIDNLSMKALILDVFVAGTETTYTVLEWAMTELLRHPEAMKKLQTETRQIASKNRSSQIITENQLNQMHYLKAVIKETLRLHPPLPLLIPHELAQDTTINGFHIASGTQVIVNAWAIGRDPANWYRPEDFWPERFLVDGKEHHVDFRGHDFGLIPFGSGRRGCPGIEFAVSLEEIALANLVFRFDWSLPFGVKIDNLDMTESSGGAIHRKFPLFAVATPYC